VAGATKPGVPITPVTNTLPAGALGEGGAPGNVNPMMAAFQYQQQQQKYSQQMNQSLQMN